MHGDCHLPHKEKTPSEGKKKTAVACSLCAGVDVLSLSLGLVQWKKKCRLSCMSAAVSCWKEGRDGRPTFPGLSLDSAGHPLSRAAACASYVAGNLVHSVRREASRAAHTALTAPVQSERAACLAEGASAHARAHRRTHAHTHGHSDPPPDVTATSKAHWLATRVIICSAVM